MLLLWAPDVTGSRLLAANLVTLVVMAASSFAVIRSPLAWRKVRSACLGTVLNHPMSTVTLVEARLMAAMAAAALLAVGL